MIKIEIELEHGNSIVKDKLTHDVAKASINLKGDSIVLANELGIGLYEIFMKNPDVVTYALEYCSRHIDKEIHKEDN